MLRGFVTVLLSFMFVVSAVAQPTEVRADVPYPELEMYLDSGIGVAVENGEMTEFAVTTTLPSMVGVFLIVNSLDPEVNLNREITITLENSGGLVSNRCYLFGESLAMWIHYEEVGVSEIWMQVRDAPAAGLACVYTPTRPGVYVFTPSVTISGTVYPGEVLQALVLPGKETYLPAVSR